MASQPPIRLDLTRQKLLIKPDDPLPRFHPPPKAIMVTPIYDYDVQIGVEDSSHHRYAYAYSRAGSANGSWHPRASSADVRQSAAHAPSLMYYPTDPAGSRRGRESLASDRFHDRRHSHYQQRPFIPSYSRSSTPDERYDRAVYSDSDSYRDERGRRASSYSPPRRLTRRHHSRDDSYYGDNRGRHEEDYPHRYSSYPQDYNQSSGNRTRERPPDDPLSQHPPDYQVQALHQAAGRAPSHGTEYSFGRYSQNTPYPVNVISPTASIVSHGGSDRRPTSVSTHGGRSPFYPPSDSGRRPTSASTHGRRSPFYPPGEGSVASRPGTHFAPSVMSGRVAPSLMSASAAGGGHNLHILDDVLRSYLKLMPPHPEWMPSRLTGKKKAVCIGINYVGQERELRGCYNDAKSMANFLITRYNFPQDQVLLLTDADAKYRLPTRKEMLSAFTWLVEGAQPNDSLFFHYSGHGGQSPDASGREADGMDDTIFPLDFKKEGDIIDDELHKLLIHPLPTGCRLTALFDSCHSGTVLDLPYLHSAHGRLRGLDHISARAKQRKSGEKSDVICFAACMDDETSADTFQDGVAVGAMSHAFLQSLERNRHQTYDQLLAGLRSILIPKYSQKPQISGTNPLDLKREFAL